MVGLHFTVEAKARLVRCQCRQQVRVVPFWHYVVRKTERDLSVPLSKLLEHLESHRGILVSVSEGLIIDAAEDAMLCLTPPATARTLDWEYICLDVDLMIVLE